MVLSLEDRLKLSVVDRARAFESHVEREIARVGTSGSGITHALELFAYYGRALVRQVDQSWDDSPTPAFKVESLRMLNRHLRERIELFDTRFAREHRRVPRAAAAAVERECARHGLADAEAVITVGPPGNYSTFVADLATTLFREIDVESELPAKLGNVRLVMIDVPALEGASASWQPIVLGHELAHYLQLIDPVIGTIDLQSAIDRRTLSQTQDPLPVSSMMGLPRSRVLEQVAVRWLNELVCDAFAVHMFGAAGAASLVEFLESVGAGSLSSRSHPPGQLRGKLMLQWLALATNPDDGRDMVRALTPAEAEIIDPLRNLAGDVVQPDWSVYLSRVLSGLSSQVAGAVRSWANCDAYSSLSREEIVVSIADRIAAGIPGGEAVETSSGVESVKPADVINAAWLALHRGATTPINRLALKALDTLDFMDHWREAGGGVEDVEDADVKSDTAGALTEPEIVSRLRRVDKSRLIVTPWLPASVKGASLDLRIGNRFIIFERSTAAAFDALSSAQDPRSMQVPIERPWGDVLYLHPGQLVLAATLEYLVLPGDLTGQVITRSSYGRLGLISATAIQVHPHFAGCLTLELVNLGQLPMVITPGERIAQLMLFTTTNPLDPTHREKYRYPTEPEFSKVRDDAESEVLSRMRQQFDRRIGRQPVE